MPRMKLKIYNDELRHAEFISASHQKHISETLNLVQGDDIFKKCHSELVSESDML